MKEVGDKFGAGELILPFVLQSAEVMKQAVAQLEQYLDKLEGYTKGTVVLATVFGDVHDIGKSLVNTILTNNGYTVVDLGKQVPIGTILDAAQEHKATAIGLSALLVSTSKQMPLAVQELHERGLEYPVLVGGAAINRDFGRRILYPKGQESDEVYDPGVFYCKDAFDGLAVMDQLVEPDKRARAASTRSATRRASCARRARSPRLGPTDDESVRSAAAHRRPAPRRRRSGACARSRSTSTRSSPTSTPTCCSSSTGAAAARRARSGASSSTRSSSRAWSACGASRTTCTRARCSATSRATRTATRRAVRPRGPRAACSRGSSSRASPGTTASASPTSTARRRRGELDVVAIQAVTAGPQVTELMAELEKQGEFAEQLFVHGLGVQTAEGMAEWLHARVRYDLGITPDQGRRYSWGYPACPDQSEHTKVFRLLGAERIGLSLSDGHAVEPGAVDGRDRRPPPAGRLLRHEVGLHPEGPLARRGHQGLREGPAPRRRRPFGRSRGHDLRRAPHAAL